MPVWMQRLSGKGWVTCMHDDAYHIAVLGDPTSVLGFKALGFDVFPTESVEAAREILTALAGRKTAVIFITEQLAKNLGPEIDRYRDEPAPAIILIPGRDGSLGIGMSNLKKSVERAVGADIL